MNRGVEVLLKRMESTPEEFMGQQGSVTKWGWVIQSVVRRAHQGYPAHSADVPYLLDDEVKAIYDKWLELQRERFTEDVLKTLLAEPENKPIDISTLRYAGAIGAITPSAAFTAQKAQESPHK